MGIRLRPATVADYPRMIAILNTQTTDRITVEEWHRADANRRPEDIQGRWVAEDAEGRIIGYAAGSHTPAGAPAGEFNLRVRVGKPYQGQGAGRALYAHAEAWCREQGATKLESSVRDDDPESQAWAERRGWVKRHHIFESRLDLSQYDPASFADVIRRVEASGIRFTTLAEEMKQGRTLREYYELHMLTWQDAPGAEGRPMPSFEVWSGWIEKDPQWTPESVFLAADGPDWIGLSLMSRLENGSYYNAFTSVHREYRGRSISLALKAVALTWAKASGAPYIRTNNHSANQPMLATNRRLGYVPQPGFYWIVKDLGS